MRVLILSTDHTGTIFYKKLEEEGNECYIVNPYLKENGINLARSLLVALQKKPELILLLDHVYLSQIPTLYKSTIPMLGLEPSLYKLETDPILCTAFCKAYNLRILKSTTKIIGPLSTEIWFSNGEPLFPYFGYIIQNRFLTGDLGPTTNGESIVFWSYKNRSPEPVKRLFEGGLFDFLKSIKYTGAFTIHSLISEDDLYPYVVNVVPRFHALSLVSILALLQSGIGNILTCLRNKENTTIQLDSKFAVAVKVTVPPYPYVLHEGFVKYLVATDDQWFSARKQLAKLIKEIDISDIQYRIDACMQGTFYDRFKEISYLN